MRVRVQETHVGRIRGCSYSYAPVGTPPPSGIPLEEHDERAITRARILGIVRDHPTLRAAEITSRLNEMRFPSQRVGYEHVCATLKVLEELGLVRADRRGKRAHRWTANGCVDDYVVSQAEPLWKNIQQSTRKLRALGFRVELELRPPGVPQSTA